MTQSRQESDWRSIYTLSIITFLMALQNGTLNINLWAYITELDPSINSVFFGYMLSFSSICNILTTFVAGLCANLMAHTLPPLIIGKVATIIGCLVFLSVELFTSQRKLVFMIMEAFFGFAIGLVSVSRAQIASASMEQDRSKAVSIHGFSLTIGIATGPLLMMAITLLKYPGITYFSSLHLNMFTLPAYLVILFAFGAIILLWCCYNGQLNEAPIVVSKELKEQLAYVKSPSYDSLAVGICCLTKICSGFSAVFMQSVNGVYIMQAFKWSSAEFVFYNSIMNGISGFAGVLFSLAYIFNLLQKWISPRQGVLISVGTHIIFFLLNYPWWFIEKRMSFEVLGVGSLNQSTTLSIGCKSNQDWCDDTPAISPLVYCISHVICLSISLPLMMLNIEILFSTLLGPIKQGTQFGIFLVCGEILNVIGPVAMTQIYETSGPRYIWTFLIGSHVVVMLVWSVFYPRMIPYSQMIEQKFRRNGSSSATIKAVEPFNSKDKINGGFK